MYMLQYKNYKSQPKFEGQSWSFKGDAEMQFSQFF